MISIRQSNATAPNESLVDTPAKENETNEQWLKRVGATDGLILLGGSSVAHFRIRYAQSHARNDLTPSYWSLAGILRNGRELLTVPLDLDGDASLVPQQNGLRNSSLAEYSDPERFPNIAFIRFTQDDHVIADHIEQIRTQRSIVDLPTLMLPWLGYIWSTANNINPLSAGLGLPSAAMVETAYGIAGIELTPGMASSASCPEAIWQTAKWWHQFYEADAGAGTDGNAGTQVPAGNFVIRQSAAAAIGPKDEMVEPQVVPIEKVVAETAKVEEVAAPKAARKAQKGSKKGGKAKGRK
jgi:hypothetical protein